MAEIQTNDGTMIPATKDAMAEADNLLMEKAKQNVRERKHLIRLVAVCAAAWIMLPILHEAIFVRPHSSYWEGQHVSDHLFDMSTTYYNAAFELGIPANTAFELGIPANTVHASIIPESVVVAMNDAAHYIQNNTGYQYTPPMFYVLLGVLLAWSGSLAVRVCKLILKRPRASSKPDPVLKEFNRLKSLYS
ncbi:MAG: hypothetical protein LBI27_06030 [Clostridiales bacterium]|nr:hypothetical protein [Clostridiales bacterium]